MAINYNPPRIAEVQPLDGRKVLIKYVTGLQGIVDLAPRLWGPIYERLATDDNLFRQVEIIGNTIRWPDDSDIAPERIWEGVMSSQGALA